MQELRLTRAIRLSLLASLVALGLLAATDSLAAQKMQPMKGHTSKPFVVPNGTPHWFQEVKGPLTYYVVKVREP